ncbi:MAG: membrane-bound lytic murein transglycosylase F [Sulfurimonas sp.]|jgi:membrane-bound lytic murein transglycosylase F|uniref:membrane-bound lytic murein transglycosylase MltF n=1 Tax=Sulfurimonas sp. TaxID=2022749 RepID=UPI0039E23EE3
MKNYKSQFLYILLALYATLLSAHCPPFDANECSVHGMDDTSKPKTVLEKIQEKETLNVVILNSPTTYYAGAEKELGFDYELISAFAKSIHVDVNLSVVFTVSEALQKSREGLGDITVSGLTVTDKRKEEFKFGPQYHTVQEQLICSSEMYKTKTFPRNEDDMRGLKIIVGKDTSYESTLNTLKDTIDGFEFTTTTEYSTEQLLDLTHKGEIDCTVADSSIFMINQRYYPKLVRALVLSDSKSLAWIIRDDTDKSLNDALYKWLNRYERSGKMAELRDYYFTFLSIFDYYDTSIFYKRLENRLPQYKKHFVGAGEKHNIPWMVLAAQSYQESHWNPNATSHTGVRGMMMLTNNTAKLLGVKNRIDVKQSIYGGAKYLRVIDRKLPPEIKGKNRWAFTLASYNVGYGHILDAQGLARKLNKNPYSWIDIKEVLPLLTQKKYFRKLKYGYARGNEPVKYVDAIQNYYDIIQKHEAKAEIKRERIAKREAEIAIEKARLRELNKGKVGLTLLPKNKVWIGYIDMKTKKKYQTIATEDLEIDPNKDWLLLFGGGNITLEVNHEIQKFSSKNNMRFKYEDGKLIKIGIEEFKNLNNGNKW